MAVSAATTIFDNSVYDLGVRFNPGTTEVGDEISLGGTERYLTSFSFEFWGVNSASPGNVSFAGPVEARVRFYQNDGKPFNGYGTPNSVFYDSGWFSVPNPTPRATFGFFAGTDFPSGGLFIPPSATPWISDLTWSVQFRNMGATDSVGVDLYSPAVVGLDYPDYWANNGGWTLQNGAVPMDFAARMEANADIPEPPVAALSLLGVLGIVRVCLKKRPDGIGAGL